MQEHKINMGVAVIKSGKRREASSCFSKLKAQTPAAVYAGVGEGHREDAGQKADPWPPPQTHWVLQSEGSSLNLHLHKLSSWFSHHCEWVILIMSFLSLEKQFSKIQHFQESTGIPIKIQGPWAPTPPYQRFWLSRSGTGILTSSFPRHPYATPSPVSDADLRSHLEKY